MPRKGIDLLLEAYLRAFGPDDDVCLIVKDFGAETFYRGQSIGAEIQALRADPRNPELLYLKTVLPAALMPRLYAACDCLVLPYRGEAFGLPILEAMACGLAAVVPDHGACLDYCDPDITVMLPTHPVVRDERNLGDIALVDRLRWMEVTRTRWPGRYAASPTLPSWRGRSAHAPVRGCTATGPGRPPPGRSCADCEPWSTDQSIDSIPIAG